MSEKAPSDGPHGAGHGEKLDPAIDLELWKHFASMGAIDKNTMLQVDSWLLGLAAAAIWFIVTDPEMIGGGSDLLSRFLHPERTMVVSLLGLLVSGAAGGLALLYGGYSNRNWAKADQIARAQRWMGLVPEGAAGTMAPELGGKPGLWATAAWRWAQPCYPQTCLAPIFKAYAGLGLLSALAHAVLFGLSLLARLRPLNGAS